MFHAKEHFWKKLLSCRFLVYNSLKWPRFCKEISQTACDRLEGRRNIVENFILSNSGHEYSFANSHIQLEMVITSA